MRLALRDQGGALAAHIPAWRDAPLSYGDATRLPRRVTARPIPLAQPPRDLRSYALDFLFDYQVFPPQIMRFAAEWQIEHRTMRAGDVIVQQAALPPATLSVKLIFAVRILDVFQTPKRVGFQYGTLHGHAESGTSTFTLVARDGKLHAVIETFSQPGHWSSRIAAPFFTFLYQQYCTNRALQTMAAHFMQANPGH